MCEQVERARRVAARLAPPGDGELEERAEARLGGAARVGRHLLGERGDRMHGSTPCRLAACLGLGLGLGLGSGLRVRVRIKG